MSAGRGSRRVLRGVYGLGPEGGYKGPRRAHTLFFPTYPYFPPSSPYSTHSISISIDNYPRLTEHA
jgi:hypothetical protein